MARDEGRGTSKSRIKAINSALKPTRDPMQIETA